MKELGPGEFSAVTGLSVKALRVYDERGLLVPARVDWTVANYGVG
jgi:DNA-binding transcriptional MerR regulator